MPLLFCKQIGTSQLGVWQKDESVAELLAMSLLDDCERREYDGIANDRRRSEWLAIRLLLNKMLNAHQPILHAESGKPYLPGCERFISISHSPNMVAVILSDTNVGIDIERIHSRTTKVRGKFLTGKELDWCTTDEQHTFVWTVKESAYKLVDAVLEHDEVEIAELPALTDDFSTVVDIRREGFGKMICHTMRIGDNFLSYLAEKCAICC